MKRLLLVLLLVGLMVLTIPSTRMRVQPGIDRFLASAGERLEGPMSPVLNPYRAVTTRSEMSRIKNRLIQVRNMGVIRPAPNEFQRFIQQRVDNEDGLDRWGSPYILLPGPDSLTIVSPGPDRAYQTEDDLSTALRYREPPRTVRRGRR